MPFQVRKKSRTAGIGTILEGRITCASGEGAIWLSWNSVEFGPQELYCGISELQNKPEQLGEKYSSLSKIGWEIMENILHDVLTN